MTPTLLDIAVALLCVVLANRAMHEVTGMDSQTALGIRCASSLEMSGAVVLGICSIFPAQNGADAALCVLLFGYALRQIVDRRVRA